MSASESTPSWVPHVLETISDAIIVLNRDWQIVYANDQALRHAGQPRADLLGRSIWDVYPMLKGSQLEANYRQAMAGQRAVHFEMRGVLSERWLEIHAYPSPEVLIVYARDVTPRHQAEEALRESEDRLRRFFDAAFEAIGIHDWGQVLDANQALADLFGYSLAELIGMDGWQLFTPESRDLIQQRIRQGTEEPYEVTGVRKDGTRLIVEVRGRDTLYRGRPARVVAIRDLTERRRAERQVREYAQRLARLSLRLVDVQEEERRHLARELHDQVGQMLTAVAINLQTAQRANGPEAARLAETLQVVDELIRQVRDLSLNLRPSMLDDFGLESALRWFTARQAERTGLTILLEADPQTGRLPAAVETACFRVVQEAITNVVRHAGARQVQVRVERQPGAVQLTVRDDGRGFDPEAVRGTSSEGRGFGMLAMRERVELLGGTFTLESAPAQGTTIRARLPVGE